MISDATVFIVVAVLRFSPQSSAAFVRRTNAPGIGAGFRTGRRPSYAAPDVTATDAGEPGERLASQPPDGTGFADAGRAPITGRDEIGRESPSSVGRRRGDPRKSFRAGRSPINHGKIKPGFWNIGKTMTDTDEPGRESPAPLEPVVARWHGRRVRFRTVPAGTSPSPTGLRWRGPRDENPHGTKRAEPPGYRDAAVVGTSDSEEHGRGSPPKPVDVRPADARCRTGPPPTEEITVKNAGRFLALRVHDVLITTFNKWAGLSKKEKNLCVILLVMLCLLVVYVTYASSKNQRWEEDEIVADSIHKIKRKSFLLSRSIVKEREGKWLRMLDNWDTEINKNYKKVRERCREGIPPSVRPKAWFYLTKANKLQENHEKRLYYKLVDQPEETEWVEAIKHDLHRSLPKHEMFADRDGPGQKELFNVLKAYTILKPEIGYWQGQSPIAAFLLTQMQTEQAFWCFVAVCDDYLSYYKDSGSETLVRDGNILMALLEEHEPHMYKFLKEQNIDPMMFTPEWFSCCFTRTLPWPLLVRMWDIFLIDGVKTFIKMGLICIKESLHEKSYSGLKKRFLDMDETINALRNPPLHLVDEDTVIKKLIKLHISEESLKNSSSRKKYRPLLTKATQSRGKG